jgi:hypothetical protein
VAPEMDIGRAVDHITDWMNTCKEKHARCSSRPSILPWRVLDIRSFETAGTIRLVETTEATGEYVALSHCWGKNRPMITTTARNLSKRKAGIAFSDLSKTFQDAIRLTYAIKAPYIWIDSLCIIQDSKDDWETESSQMASIYANSTLNIAATAARDGDDGLFRSRWTPGHMKNAVQFSPMRFLGHSKLLAPLITSDVLSSGHIKIWLCNLQHQDSALLRLRLCCHVVWSFRSVFCHAVRLISIAEKWHGIVILTSRASAALLNSILSYPGLTRESISGCPRGQ